MHLGHTPTLSGDRAGDRPTVVAGDVKPPVLGRRGLRGLCLACLAVIVWGTLGPVAGGDGPWLVAPPGWRWLPPVAHSDLNDLLTNLSIYVPVGIAFRLLARRRGRAGLADLLAGLGLSIALSYLTEAAQQAIPARSSNLTDVAVNSLAALVGCLIAVPVQRLLRRWHSIVFARARDPRQRWVLLSGSAAIGAAVLMTAPWRLTAPSAELGFDRPLSPPDMQRFTIFLVVGFLAAGAGLMRGWRARRAVPSAAMLTVVLAVALESSQAVLGGHVCSLMHALVSVGGVAAGCLAAPVFLRPTTDKTGSRARTPGPVGERGNRGSPSSPSGGLRSLAATALTMTLAYAVVIGLWQGGPLVPLRSEPLIQWVPFHAQFVVPFAAMLADLVQQLAAYTVLTLACLLLTRGRGRGVSLLLLVGLVGSLEACKAFWHPSGADTTAPLLALASWLATVWAWRSLCPRRRRSIIETT